jgi:hypothetical protein
MLIDGGVAAEVKERIVRKSEAPISMVVAVHCCIIGSLVGSLRGPFDRDTNAYGFQTATTPPNPPKAKPLFTELETEYDCAPVA